MGVALLALQMVLSIVIPWRFLRWDMSRLTQARLDRAWPESSFWIAIIVFGPLCIPFHFARTRRSVVGFLVGLAWAAVFLGAMYLSLIGLHWVLTRGLGVEG